MRFSLLLLAWLVLASPAAAQAVDFTRDVQPILKRCVSCHGPEKQRSGLRLDSAAGALRGGDSGPILVRGVQPSAEAERTTLLRRLSLDLTGLPPTPAEVDAFLADTQPGAYERQVERLLKSPHYGERWGRHWLDAARYADSNGYNADAA